MPIHDWTQVNAGLFHHFHQMLSVRSVVRSMQVSCRWAILHWVSKRLAS
jgi:hypothetical protein